MLYQAALFVLLCLSVRWIIIRLLRPSKLPPSPKGLPLIGNLLQLPRQLQFLKLTAWAQELGDIYTLNLAGKKLIVLSSAKAASEVLDRMSSVTSGRPRMVMVSDSF